MKEIQLRKNDAGQRLDRFVGKAVPLLPESLLRAALPVGLKFVLRFIFRAAKDYPDECEQTRKDIDRRLSAALREWTADIE